MYYSLVCSINASLDEWKEPAVQCGQGRLESKSVKIRHVSPVFIQKFNICQLKKKRQNKPNAQSVDIMWTVNCQTSSLSTL